MACVVVALLGLFVVPDAGAQGIPPQPPLPPNAPRGAHWSWRELNVPVTKAVYNKSLTDLTAWLRANYPNWKYLDRYAQGAGAFRLVIGRWTLVTPAAVIIPPNTGYGGSVYCRRYPGDPVCRRRG